jgi:hypothetical protein
MNRPDLSFGHPFVRAAAAACLLAGLAVCAYAGGQTRRAPRPAAAPAKRGGTTLASIRAKATTGRAAKPGPSANVGQQIALLGSGFDNNVSVQFTAFANSTFSVAPLKVKGKRVTIPVPNEVVTGDVRLIDPESGTSDPRVLQIVPKIDTLTPEAAAPGSRLLVDGSGFTHDAMVTFKGVAQPVAPTVVSPTRIDIQIPATAQPGRIQIVTGGGTSRPAKLTVVGAKAPEPKAPPARRPRRASGRR